MARRSHQREVVGSREAPTVVRSGGASQEKPRDRAAHGELKRQRTRQQLLQSALELFGRAEGWDTQIEEVVSLAGMARGTFYNYFESRGELLNVLASELNTPLDVALEGAPDAVTRTACAIRSYITRAARDRRWAWVMVNVSKNGGKAFGEETYRYCTETLEAGMLSGAYDIPSVQAGLDAVLGTTLHAVQAVCEGRCRSSHASDVTRIVLLGLGIRRSKVDRYLTSALPTNVHEPVMFARDADTSRQP